MKKRQILLAVIMTMVMVCMAACGGNSSGDYAGVYTFESMKSGDTSYTMKEFADLIGISEDEAKDYMKLELKSDGTVVLKVMGEDDDNGTWKADGNTIYVTGSNGKEESCTIDGDKITIKMGEEEVILAKE